MSENTQRATLHCSQQTENQQPPKLSPINLSTNSMHYQKHVCLMKLQGRQFGYTSRTALKLKMTCFPLSCMHPRLANASQHARFAYVFWSRIRIKE